MEAFYPELIALAQVIVIDVVLAGDNAIVVGLAASRVAPEMRARVIFWGIAGAVVLRIAFAGVTMQLLAIVGLTLAGGIIGGICCMGGIPCGGGIGDRYLGGGGGVLNAPPPISIALPPRWLERRAACPGRRT